jgi:hypothetical protein
LDQSPYLEVECIYATLSGRLPRNISVASSYLIMYNDIATGIIIDTIYDIFGHYGARDCMLASVLFSSTFRRLFVA